MSKILVTNVRGKSAYEQATAAGYSGSEAEFNALLNTAVTGTITDQEIVGNDLVVTRVDGSTENLGRVRGLDGSNVLPTQEAIIQELTEPGPVKTQLESTIAEGVVGLAATPTDPSWAYLSMSEANVAMPPTPYGHSDYVHPSVVDMGAGSTWNGYRYWMAITPLSYPSDAKQENPCIYASNDGDTWVEPTGLVNPIVPPPTFPAAAFNADTELVIVAGTAYCFFTVNGNVNSETYSGRVTTSTDGVTWTTPSIVYSHPHTEHRYVSPTVIFEDGLWRLWAIDEAATPYSVVYMESESLSSGWSEPQVCTIAPALPAGRSPWHLQVRRAGDTLLMLLNDTVTGVAGSEGVLYMLASDAGVTWHRALAPLTGRITALSTSLYRSSFVPVVRGGEIVLDSWIGVYDNISSTITRRLARGAIKFASGRAGSAQQRRTLEVDSATVTVPPFVVGDDFNRADGALGSAPSGQAWESLTGSPVIENGIVTSVASETITVVESGASDVFIEVDFATFNGGFNTGQVIFRAKDATNYWAFGWFNGLHIRCVYNGSAGGAGHFPTLSTPKQPGVGTRAEAPMRIGIRVKGDKITRYINGFQFGPVLTITNSTLLHGDATKHGFRLSGTAWSVDAATIRAT